MKVCKSIKQLRERLELTQKQLASLLRVKQATVSAWEVNVCYPSLRNVKKIMDLAEKHNLKITMQYLLSAKIN